MYLRSKFDARTRGSWVLAVMLLCGSIFTPLAGYPYERIRVPYQTKSKPEVAQDLDRRLKWLGTVMEGNIVEVGKRSDKYDLYKYESFHSAGCSLGWRVSHESYDGDALQYKEIQELRMSLSALDRSSVRVDKVGDSAYVVSFTTQGLENKITSRGVTTRQDQSEDKYVSLQSGSGVYFRSNGVARRVAQALMHGIGSCKKGTS
jgi:hypothetical protein